MDRVQKRGKRITTSPWHYLEPHVMLSILDHYAFVPPNITEFVRVLSGPNSRFKRFNIYDLDEKKTIFDIIHRLCQVCQGWNQVLHRLNPQIIRLFFHPPLSAPFTMKWDPDSVYRLPGRYDILLSGNTTWIDVHVYFPLFSPDTREWIFAPRWGSGRYFSCHYQIPLKNPGDYEELLNGSTHPEDLIPQVRFTLVPRSKFLIVGRCESVTSCGQRISSDFSSSTFLPISKPIFFFRHVYPD